MRAHAAQCERITMTSNHFRMCWDRKDTSGRGQYCFHNLTAVLNFARDYAQESPDATVWVEHRDGRRWDIHKDFTQKEG